MKQQESKAPGSTSASDSPANRPVRFTPESITSLAPGEVFVFGSNLAGMHGGGAARVAMQRFGAVWGQGWGCKGNPMPYRPCRAVWRRLNLMSTSLSPLPGRTPNYASMSPASGAALPDFRIVK